MNKKMRVLVVDDFSSMRRMVKTILKKMQFSNIIEADDGKSAMLMLKKYDVGFIISDWNMPEMKGLDLLKEVRKNPKLKKIPFLMLTAEAQKPNIIEAIQADVSGYVIKPFTEQTLIEKIEKVLE